MLFSYLTFTLLVVVSLWQDKTRCEVSATTETLTQEPCPGASKYLKVAYKCSPGEFRHHVTCQSSDMSLDCPRSQRIVIYSATFGRTGEPNAECPVSPELNIDCQSTCAVGLVKHRCEGKKRCSLTASIANFGSPCPTLTPMFLSVIYTCLPRKLLPDVSDDRKFPERFCGAISFPPRDNVTQAMSAFSTEGNMRPETATASASEMTALEGDAEDRKFAGFVTDWIRTLDFISENREKFALYIVVSILIGITFILMFIIARLLFLRRRQKSNKASSTQSVEMTKSTTLTPPKSVSVDHINGPNGYPTSRYPPSEGDTLPEVEEEEPLMPNNVHIPSYNQYSSLRYPVQTSNKRQAMYTNSLDRRGMYPPTPMENDRVGSPAYDNTFRTSSNRINQYSYA